MYQTSYMKSMVRGLSLRLWKTCLAVNHCQRRLLWERALGLTHGCGTGKQYSWWDVHSGALSRRVGWPRPSWWYTSNLNMIWPCDHKLWVLGLGKTSAQTAEHGWNRHIPGTRHLPVLGQRQLLRRHGLEQLQVCVGLEQQHRALVGCGWTLPMGCEVRSKMSSPQLSAVLCPPRVCLRPAHQEEPRLSSSLLTQNPFRRDFNSCKWVFLICYTGLYLYYHLICF